MEKNNKILPVMLFQGTQSLLIEREVEAVREIMLKKHPGINHLTFHMDSDAIEKLIESANTISMFGEKKLLVAKNCESLKSKDLVKLNSYIESPSPDTYVILVSGELNRPKLKKSRYLVTRVFNKVNMVEAQIQKEAQLLGINISKQACMEIHRLIGDDFTIINSELIKISNYFGDKKKIDEEDIEKFILKRNDEDIFNLINSISDRQPKSAFRILKNLENQKYEPLSIVSTLSWRIRQIWQVKELMDLNKNDREIAEKLKISSGAVYYIKKQANNFSAKSLSSIISSLKTLDIELKSYSQDKYNLLCRFIIGTCRQDS